MNLLSVFLISTKRLWNNKGLALCSILGLMVAVASSVPLPLYADAANYRSLQEEFGPGPLAVNANRNRPLCLPSLYRAGMAPSNRISCRPMLHHPVRARVWICRAIPLAADLRRVLQVSPL
jgi:hypothetical protein